MNTAEELDMPYLFKLKISSNVKKLIERLMSSNECYSAGQGWDQQIERSISNETLLPKYLERILQKFPLY